MANLTGPPKPDAWHTIIGTISNTLTYGPLRLSTAATFEGEVVSTPEDIPPETSRYANGGIFKGENGRVKGAMTYSLPDHTLVRIEFEPGQVRVGHIEFAARAETCEMADSWQGAVVEPDTGKEYDYWVWSGATVAIGGTVTDIAVGVVRRSRRGGSAG